jgi:hypothetical protein
LIQHFSSLSGKNKTLPSGKYGKMLAAEVLVEPPPNLYRCNHLSILTYKASLNILDVHAV